MAFEGVASKASISVNSMGNHVDGEVERIEMNSNQYPNYRTNYNQGIEAEPDPFIIDDMDEHFKEEVEKNLSYRNFIYNNSEQLKCIFGGNIVISEILLATVFQIG